MESKRSFGEKMLFCFDMLISGYATQLDWGDASEKAVANEDERDE